MGNPAQQLRRVLPGVLLAASAAVQMAAVWRTQGVIWPDEIHQSVEQAHRLVFGYGFIPWEFHNGARSWVWPGLLAIVIRAIDLSGWDTPRMPLLAARLTAVVFSLFALAGAMRLAATEGGRRAAIATGLILASWPLWMIYGSRCASEIASAPLIVAVVLLTSGPASVGRHVTAGVLGALACFLRYQNGLVLAVVLGLAVRRDGVRATRWILAGAVPTLLWGGLLDTLTWGRPFHSLLTYLRFNLFNPAAAGYGVQPPWFYAETLWTSTGPFLLILIIGMAGAARHVPSWGVIGAAYVALHTIVGHKETRFLLPVLPLLAALAGTGLTRLDQRARPHLPPWGLWALLAVGAATMGLRTSQLTMGDLGYRHARDESPWRLNESYNRLLWAAAERPDLCGIGLIGTQPVWTGGYSYLHRDVPFLNARVLAISRGEAANYVIAPAAVRLPEYEPVGEHGALRLLRREGRCAPPPAEHSVRFGY